MRIPPRSALVLAVATGLALTVAPGASAVSWHARSRWQAGHMPAGTAPGTISTIAGGVGGPGRATAIGLAQRQRCAR